MSNFGWTVFFVSPFIAPKSVQVFWDTLYDVLEKIVKTFWIFIFVIIIFYNRQFVFTASTPLVGASAVP